MNFKAIDIKTGKQLVEENDPVIVDVRDAKSFQDAHIEEAELVNETTLEDFLQRTSRQRPILVYCYHGHMSRNAAEYFTGLGFSEVYSLDGGFEAWRQKYPVDSSSK